MRFALLATIAGGCVAGEIVTPDDGIQPIPSDHIGQFVVPLDRPFECP